MKETLKFVDLHAQYLTIKNEIDEAIATVIAESSFVRGHHVVEFEDRFAETLGMKHCVSTANGTDSLFIAMRALGVKPGDEVIAPAHTWISTTETITLAGAKVVFCDTEIDTFTIDPRRIEEKITDRTVGIIPVHLFGQAADMSPIMEIANNRGLWVLEDCAQAHLAKYKGQYVGTFGNAASYSFYPGKNLGAMGDAGAVVTDDENLAQAMAMFARHGGLSKGDHRIEGINSRLDGMQAAILNVKLSHLKSWTESRQRIARTYDKELSEIGGLQTPTVRSDCEHVWHLYVVQHSNRDELAAHLREKNIQTVINYPIALPYLPAYERFGHKPEDFPVAFGHQSRILSLPIFPEMTDGDVGRVAEAIGEFASARN